MVERRKEQSAAPEESEALKALPRRVFTVVPVPVAKSAQEAELHPPSAVIERLAGHYSGRKSESTAVSGKAIEASTKTDFDCRIARNKEYYKVDWVPLHEKLPGIIARMQA